MLPSALPVHLEGEPPGNVRLVGGLPSSIGRGQSHTTVVQDVGIDSTRSVQTVRKISNANEEPPMGRTCTTHVQLIWNWNIMLGWLGCLNCIILRSRDAICTERCPVLTSFSP